PYRVDGERCRPAGGSLSSRLLETGGRCNSRGFCSGGRSPTATEDRCLCGRPSSQPRRSALASSRPCLLLCAAQKFVRAVLTWRRDGLLPKPGSWVDHRLTGRSIPSI